MRKLRRVEIPLFGLSCLLAGCEPAPEPTPACAMAGSDFATGDETVAVAELVPVDAEAACTGTWIEQEFEPATWTVTIGAGVADGAWQLAPHTFGGAVFATPEQFGWVDEEGQLAWVQDTPGDLNQHALYVENDQIIGMARLESEWLELVVFDSSGALTKTVSLGPVGSDGLGHFVKHGEYYVAANHDEDGPLLMRLDSSFEVTVEQPLGFAVGTPFLALDAYATVFYGEGPSRILDADGQLLAELGDVPEVLGQGQRAFNHVVGQWEGFILAGQSGERMQVRAIDRDGMTTMTAGRARAELDSGAEAINTMESVGNRGGVVVGWEQVGDIAESTLDRQPLIVTFGEDGEPDWIDRIAVTGSAQKVGIGVIAEIYVGGIAEVRDGQGELQTTTWIRRYDAPDSGPLD